MDVDTLGAIIITARGCSLFWLTTAPGDATRSARMIENDFSDLLNVPFSPGALSRDTERLE